MPWSPTGIDVSERFRRYVGSLRETWTIDEQKLAAARGDESISQRTNA